jgi:predicted RecA/RadA family phage recombinase
MNAVFVQNGDSIDYTPTADVPAGAVVVQGELVGVTKRPIPANTLGSLAVSGVFDFPKATTAGSAISAGANVYWNATAQVVTTTATGNKLVGKTIKAVVDADATVRVRLSQ